MLFIVMPWASPGLPQSLKIVSKDMISNINFVILTFDVCHEGKSLFVLLCFVTCYKYIGERKYYDSQICLMTICVSHSYVRYILDISGVVNAGNLKFQGRQTTFLELRYNVASFRGKLQLWIKRIGKGIVAQFSTFYAFLDQQNSEDILDDSRDHLNGFLESLEKYFPDLDSNSKELI